MGLEVNIPVDERIVQLFQHLGIQKAHFAGSVNGDWGGLAATHPEVISSLTLVCPMGMDPNPIGSLAPRLLIFTGDRGAPAETLHRIGANLPEATMVTLSDYFSPLWADVIVDRREEVGSAMFDFLGHRSNCAPSVQRSP